MPFFRVKPSYVYVDLIKGTRIVRKAYHEGQIVELENENVGDQPERLELVTEADLSAIREKLKKPVEGEIEQKKEEKPTAKPLNEASRNSAVSKLKGEQAQATAQNEEGLF